MHLKILCCACREVLVGEVVIRTSQESPLVLHVSHVHIACSLRVRAIMSAQP